MKVPSYVYKITQLDTMKSYIGLSSNPPARFKSHLWALKSGKHPIEDMQEDFNLYGENYAFNILEKIDSIRYKPHEIIWQNFYNTNERGKGYNYKDKGKKIATRWFG